MEPKQPPTPEGMITIPGEPKHVLVNMGTALIRQVDDFSYANRLRTRNQAIRLLLEFALHNFPKNA